MTPSVAAEQDEQRVAPRRAPRRSVRRWTQVWPLAVLTGLAVVFLGVSVLYGINLWRWSQGPDFGWHVSNQMDSTTLTEVYGAAARAGMQVGDRILRVNQAPVTSVRQIQQQLVRTSSGVNIYDVQRQRQVLTIVVPIEVLGLQKAFFDYGATWVLGIVFFLMGAVVFVMKPNTRPSWAFLSMMFNAGLLLSFSMTGKLSPDWLGTVYIFGMTFCAAGMLHLAQTFPTELPWVQHCSLALWAPYGLSLGLFVILRMAAPFYVDAPVVWRKLTDLYLVFSLIAFLGSSLFAYLHSSSLIARTRSLVILVGLALSLLFPVANMIATIVFHAPLIPTPVFNLPFFIFLPLSIGYAIAKHDLFAIDLVVRRTCGYVLSTATILGLYGLLVSLLNVTFQSSAIAQSPLFSLLFALGIIFFFNPLHQRLQRLIDRLFYRQQYDYRKTIRDTSETMINILDQEAILSTVISSVVREMFLESGLILLPEAADAGYRVRLIEGIAAETLGTLSLSKDDALLQALQEKKTAIFRHEIEADPYYDETHAVLLATYRALAAELILPLKYKNDMRGILALGRKKSGKMFTPEDLDLLTTMLNQTAVALENAKLFEENIEKSRMEEELKIARDIQTSMLPQHAPKLPGVTIAASSFAAREVGGDFYDFIEIEHDAADKQVAIVVGDVSGKAVSGALVMAAARSVFRVLAESHTSVQQVMMMGNACLNRDIKKGMFVALVYAVLDPARKVMTLANAGQTAPIVCPGDHSAPAYIETGGDKFPLGIVRKARYEETQVALHPGDTLVFYTDGIVEAMNAQEELYGFERFMAAIEAGRSLDANTLLTRLIQDVEDFVGAAEQHDDLTIVVAQVA